MRTFRIYLEKQFNNNTIVLDKEQSHYLKNVLRVKTGWQVRVFNSNHQEVLTQVTRVDRHEVELEIIEQLEPYNSSKLCITVVQAISKGERMDYTVQKATELGVHAIQPVFSEFCDVKLDEKRMAKKLKHWRNIAISASEQCFRPDVPILLEPMSVEIYAQKPRGGFFLDPEQTSKLSDFTNKGLIDFDIAIGPEGGWSEADIELLKSCGLAGVVFGERVLRTETATPAILSAVHTLWGDFV